MPGTALPRRTIDAGPSGCGRYRPRRSTRLAACRRFRVCGRRQPDAGNAISVERAGLRSPGGERGNLLGIDARLLLVFLQPPGPHPSPLPKGEGAMMWR